MAQPEEQNININSESYSVNTDYKKKVYNNNNLNKNEHYSVPDSWSNIAELIDNSSPSNNTINPQLEPKPTVINENKFDTFSSIKQTISNREIFLNKKFKSLAQKNYVQPSLNPASNIEVNHSEPEYRIQLLPQKTIGEGYQYQSLNHNKISRKEILNNQPLIKENDNSNLSRKEEVSVEPEGEIRETEATSHEETELLDILAGEIYNLLQQRIEIERERQGKYYR